MNVNKLASAHTLKSDLKRVDSHKPKASDYSELPELTDAMLARGVVKRGVHIGDPRIGECHIVGDPGSYRGISR